MTQNINSAKTQKPWYTGIGLSLGGREDLHFFVPYHIQGHICTDILLSWKSQLNRIGWQEGNVSATGLLLLWFPSTFPAKGQRAQRRAFSDLPEWNVRRRHKASFLTCTSFCSPPAAWHKLMTWWSNSTTLPFLWNLTSKRERRKSKTCGPTTVAKHYTRNFTHFISFNPPSSKEMDMIIKSKVWLQSPHQSTTTG